MFEIGPTGADFLPSHALDASYSTLQVERLIFCTQASSAHIMSSLETVTIGLVIKGIPSATLALS